MSVPLQEVPAVAAAAWLELRGELLRILGNDLVALWGWGSTVRPDRPLILSDLDAHAVVTRPIDERTWGVLQAALADTARTHGVQWDISFTLAAETRGSELPRSPLLSQSIDRRDVMWAVNRAHWLAGWFVPLLGPTPPQLITPPRWPELEYALGRELEHLERHVIDGPHDAYEGRCAIFNGSRILYARATGDATMSKRAGGAWALENLPAQWHETIRVANHTYDTQPTPAETEMLVVAMGPFVAMVREHVPDLDDRRSGDLPRWSV
jgi:hypothetical protein